MQPLLRARGIDAELNTLGDRPYDIALVHWARADLIKRVLGHSPRAHIGVLNPGYLCFDRRYVRDRDYDATRAKLEQIVSNVDFFVVTGFMWRELLLPTRRRVYETIDYIEELETKPLKRHLATSDLVIGYHGNELHFAEDFAPWGHAALQRLAREHEFVLKLLTRNAHTQPLVAGVRTERIEWELDTYERHLQTFDIGICPVFNDLGQLKDPFTYIRNSNRVNSLLAYGIPSVASPVFQSCHDHIHEGTTIFAFTEEGWYNALKRLMENPALRNAIGNRGRHLVKRRFSADAAVTSFIHMLEAELSEPLTAKTGFMPGRPDSGSFWQASIRRLTNWFYDHLRGSSGSVDAD